MRSRRHRNALSLGACLALALGAPASAGLSLKGILPGQGYAVDGKKGKFFRQVATRTVGAASLSAKPLGLDGALDKGEYEAAVLRMPALEKRVSEFILKLDQAWPYPRGGPVKVYVVGVTNYLAKAKPDGSIVVSIGLLEKVQSDDELALALGHELSHVRLGHFSKNSNLAKQKQAISRIGAAYYAGIALSQSRVQQQQGGAIKVVTQNDKALRDAAQRATAADDQLRLIVDILVEPAWARSQEDEADVLGLDLAERAGFVPDAVASDVFGQLQAEFDLQKASVAALQAQMKESVAVLTSDDSIKKMMAGESQQVFDKLWSELQKGVRDKLFSLFTGLFAQKHRTPEARQTGLGAYCEAAYPASGEEALKAHPVQTAWIKQTQLMKDYAQALMVTHAVDAARKLRGEGRHPEALKEIGKALASPMFKAEPLVANEAARIYRDSGDITRADQQFSIADASPTQTVEGFRGHVDMLVRAQRFDRAKAVIALGTARMKDEKPFLPPLVAIAMRSGKTDEAVAYLARCMATEDPKLRSDCTFAILDPSSQAKYEQMSPADQEKVDNALRKSSSNVSILAGWNGLMDIFKPKDKTE